MEPLVLREYQQELYQGVVKAFKRGFKRPLVVAPCGAGKSFLFAEMARRTRGEALVLTHRQELKRQHEELFRKLQIPNVRVAMILTEANRLGKHSTPALIVTDEAHLSRSERWMKVIEYYDTWTVGMTATPVRMDGKPLGSVFDVLIEGVDTKWLIEHRHLAPYEYYAPTLVDANGLEKVAGDYAVPSLERLMNERAVYGNVIKMYRRFAEGERSIAYCVSVAHAKATADAFLASGIRAKSISAKTPAKERQRIMAAFRAGEFSVLCNVGIISEGVSIDEVTCCMLLRPTESVALGIQQMMRCMRYLPGKTAKIIDFVGNYTRVGFADEKRIWSLETGLKKRVTINSEGDFYIRCCPECYKTFRTAPICPYCGTAYPLHPREIRAHEEIELQRITREEAALIEQEKKNARLEQGRAASFEELVKLGRKRGYKNPAFWAANVMRGRKR